jgi:hypothetical protein
MTLLPDLEEEDVQGFLNKEISKSEILDVVCTTRNFGNINEETLNNAYREMGTKWTSST